MKKYIFSVLIMVLVSCVTMANDCVFYVRGNQLVPSNEEKDIAVEKEILTISLQDNGKTSVSVYYEMNNKSGSEKTVEMGFEASTPYNSGDVLNSKGIHPYISNFTVNMNGNVIPYSNAIVENNIPNGFKPLDMNVWKKGSQYDESLYQMLDNGNLSIEYSYAYYFSAKFQPGVNRILHTYQYDTSNGVGVAYMIDYKLTPALRWANKQIDDFTLVVRADNTAKHFTINNEPFKNGEFKLDSGTGKCRKMKYYDKEVIEFTLRNGAFSWHGTNFKTTEELSLNSAENLYVSMHEPSEEMPIGFTYDRNINFGYMSPIDTEFEVRIAHNLPYAHRGYAFTKPEMKKYFEDFWWYMPDPDYKISTDDFTERDWYFVNFKLEK